MATPAEFVVWFRVGEGGGGVGMGVPALKVKLEGQIEMEIFSIKMYNK